MVYAGVLCLIVCGACVIGALIILFIDSPRDKNNEYTITIVVLMTFGIFFFLMACVIQYIEKYITNNYTNISLYDQSDSLESGVSIDQIH